jgi:hypothetical protein
LEKFRRVVESGSIQNVWDRMHSDWKSIFGSMELQGKLIGIAPRNAGEFQQQQAALQKHCEERIQKMETSAQEPTLEDDPGEVPWA